MSDGRVFDLRHVLTKGCVSLRFDFRGPDPDPAVGHSNNAVKGGGKAVTISCALGPRLFFVSMFLAPRSSFSSSCTHSFCHSLAYFNAVEVEFCSQFPTFSSILITARTKNDESIDTYYHPPPLFVHGHRHRPSNGKEQ